MDMNPRLQTPMQGEGYQCGDKAGAVGYTERAKTTFAGEPFKTPRHARKNARYCQAGVYAPVHRCEPERTWEMSHVPGINALPTFMVELGVDIDGILGSL